MTSADFKPEFQSNVIVLVGGFQQNVNPMYCATPQCASDLASILQDMEPSITFLPAFGPMFHGYCSPLVPFLSFPQGVLENAGQLASLYTHGYPPDLAEKWIRQSINGDIAALQQSQSGS